MKKKSNYYSVFVVYGLLTCILVDLFYLQDFI